MSGKRDFKKHPRTAFNDVNDLTKEKARQEIEALREGIEFHDHKYYVENNPVIADSVYDKLFHRLVELEDAFPEFQTEDSPTQRVGAEPVESLKRIEHKVPMLSLNAAFAESEFEEFHDFVRRRTGDRRLKYVVEPKFDGVSVEVVYDQGRFQYAATRGDGQVGEDVSANLRTIRSVPLALRENGSPPKLLAVRGEVFISRDGFRRMNRERVERGEEPYANPRNAAAGILRRLESREVAGRPLDIVFYDILEIDGREFETHWDELRQFPKWGLKTDPHVERCSSKQDVVAFHKNLEEERDNLAHEIDGIVIKLDDKKLWRDLGTRQRSPRWALAWKFRPREEITTLEDIVVQVGRTGKLTPVALLQPVDVSGVTVSRATLHNEGEVHKKDVRPGDLVRVVRAGDVIPEVLERIKRPGRKRSKPFNMPRKCPVCGTGIVREGAYHVCPAGLSCEPQLVGTIINYASRGALDIEGLGEKTVYQLVKKGLVENLADLYELTVKDLLGLEGFAATSAKKLYDAIQGSRTPRLDKFLYGLGIRHVGERAARILAREFGSLDAVRRADASRLNRVRDIGSEIAQSVHTFFEERENRRVLKRMQRQGVTVKDMPTPKEKSLEGKTFVFTGELDNFTRSQATEAVESLGGRVTSSVSGQTDYVVVGTDPGGKLDEAREYGVEILNENAFAELLTDT